MRKVIYSIQGNIGSGKSTLLKAVMNSISNVTTIKEPVDSWQHVAGYNLLDKYYEDPTRWGYTFQINCILSRMTQLSNSIQTMKRDKFYISQRSVQSDKFIFAKLMHKLKKINDMEYHLYLQMFQSLENLFNKHSFSDQQHKKLHYANKDSQLQYQLHKKSSVENKPILYRHIYLKTSPEKCFERIRKRNRFEEKNIQFDYIKQLDHLHDDWLIEGQKAHQHNLILDGQRQFQTDKGYLNELISQIKAYIIENSEFGQQFEFVTKIKEDQRQALNEMKYYAGK